MAEGGREPVGDESLENWKELGSGGFGYVYKANHRDWQFEVAIKLLAGQAALEREADYMDSVAHQFVPRVYGMYRGIPPVPELGSIKRQGIVMELMLGGSLQNLQQALSGPPPWPLAFRLAHQVALAMNFLHSKKSPVVHSDLKPGNVLLDASLGAKIADFGLSTVSTSVLNITNKGDEGGTLAYTPPEAFEQGQDYRLVRSYDIYSYGILLWTILTGKEPYLAGVKRDVLTFRIIKGDRPDLDKIDQSKAEGLEELVDLMKKCWDKDPTKRPTFRGCTEVTGRVFSKHEKGIHAAVTETLTKLDSVNRQECVRPPGREPVGDESLENWKELGSGGFGYVYKANHKDLQCEVAIKLDVGPGTLGREADYTEAVSHQFVPRVYGMYRGIPPDPKLGRIERQGIVMELMLGGSLQNLQQALSGPPPWPLAFRLAHQVALAMNFLHSKKPPVVHSNLKPGNVLLDVSLGAKIADFGLSTVSTSVLNITNKCEGGTLAYTPPEAFGQDYRFVRSYDIYSYGILLWTILTGKEPYLAGENRYVLAFRIIKGDRPDLGKIDQSKAEGLEELVDLMKKCWDKDPTKRPTFRGCTEVTGRVFSKHEKGIHAAVTETLTKLDSVNRQECVRQPVFHCLTLDTNTAHRFLSLSENNMKVTWGGGPDPPDHPARFDGPIQVLCTEALTGCHYWEVERSGAVSVAVTYRGISRKGQGKDCRLGCNDNSWSLNCSDGNVYSVIHNSKRTHVPVSSSRYSKRVAVYLDCSAGTLSFYEVSSDTLTPLFHFQNTFTEPLYAGFRLPYSSSSVCLCKDSYSTANPFKDEHSETKINSY